MKKTGIVLSGGGARGAAHLGVLKALDELEIEISAISGVSAGAVIGALYAAGVSPEKILETLKAQTYFGIKDFLWMKNGLFNLEGLRKKLTELIPVDDFAGLKIPLFIVATDILTGTSITFSDGPLHDVIIGSASVPVVFEPKPFKNYQLLDGGILNNLPIEPLLGCCNVIIGSHVNKLHDANTPISLDKTALMDQCFHLVIANSVKERAKACHIYFEPLLAGFGIFEMKHADQIFEIGYNAAMDQRESLLELKKDANNKN
jgi:NTE family protein